VIRCADLRYRVRALSMGGPDLQHRELLHGRYRLQEPLARGGMGTVWRAYDELLGRTVAVKEVLLPPGLSEEERTVIRQRTLREARAAARLNHPGVVTVFDVVEEQDRPWIVMALLPSRTLAQVIREDGPLPPDVVAKHGIALLDALDAAHDAGVLHRDVKPANVLVTHDGRTILTDFGIATVEGDSTITTSGLLVGSPAYVAPERARGLSPGPSADLWSLGATLYAAVDGRAPFERTNTFSTLTAVLTEPPPPSDRLGPLAPVIEGLLVKDPEDRLGATVARIMLVEAAEAKTAPAAEPPAAAAATTPLAAPASRAAADSPADVATDPSPPARPAQQPAPAPAQAQARASAADLLSKPVPAAPIPWEPAGPDAGRGLQHPNEPLDAIENVAEARKRPRRRAALAILTGLLVVGALVVARLAGLGGDLPVVGDGQAAPEASPSSQPATPEAAPTGAESADPVASEGTLDSSGSSGSGSGSDSSGSSSGQSGSSSESGGSGSGGAQAAAAVPAGFTLHRDQTGFSIAVPEGWTPVRSGTLVDFREPNGRRFLRIDQTEDPKPDPQQDWLDQEPSVANRLAGYERLSMERVNFRGWEASDWLFEWTASGGRLRVLNRGLTTGEYGYALYWSVPEGQWEESRSIFDVAAATFTPAA
jgi:eukaryotic-like serine/threonine-protein kinase